MIENYDEIIAKFKENKFYFSYSSIKKLLYNPTSFFNDYILNQKEEIISKSLLGGKLAHCLLLEPNKFNDKFTLLETPIPEGNNFTIVLALYKEYLKDKTKGDDINNYKEFILKLLVDINLHQSLVNGKKPGEQTGDEKRLDKVITKDNAAYFKALTSGNTIVDKMMYENAKAQVTILNNNPKILKLLTTDEFSNNEVFNELELSMEGERFQFGLKGIIDNVLIDHDTKIVYVNDFKTTAKVLDDFKETMEFYKYNLQAAIYLLLVARKFSNLCKEGYEIIFHFIVIDKNFHEYAFEVSEDTIINSTIELEEILKQVDYHYTNNKYRLPYKFNEDMEPIVL